MVAAVAQPALGRRQRQERRAQPLPLGVGPARLGLVEDGHVGHLVDLQQRRAPAAPQVQGDGDDDAPEPGDETGRILEIAQPPEGPQIRLLGGVLGQPGIAQHAQRDGAGHRLRLGHDQRRRPAHRPAGRAGPAR